MRRSNSQRRKPPPQISHPIFYDYEKPLPRPVPISTTDENLTYHKSGTAHRHGGYIDIAQPPTGQGGGSSLPPIMPQPPLGVSGDAFGHDGMYGHGSHNVLGHGAETTGESSGSGTGTGTGVEAGVGAEGGGGVGGEGGEGGAGGEGGCG
ncbi:hypothetical protein V865_002957 [Kwoniella europaea PYCC6329]|uniref:Uncharacterized protein n=1 Tax=Kwoniella europaea PYCC6329 TaxID=1423913 RepID=A0AAX4KE79_9TREE